MSVPAGFRTAIGREIETLAWTWWLDNRPASRLLARNYRRRGGELDLVVEEYRASGAKDLVFIEVRARRGPGRWVSGLESVDHVKRACLERAARSYLWGYRGNARGVRFDVLDWDGDRFHHYESAWTPRA